MFLFTSSSFPFPSTSSFLFIPTSSLFFRPNSFIFPYIPSSHFPFFFYFIHVPLNILFSPSLLPHLSSSLSSHFLPLFPLHFRPPLLPHLLPSLSSYLPSSLSSYPLFLSTHIPLLPPRFHSFLILLRFPFPLISHLRYETSSLFVPISLRTKQRIPFCFAFSPVLHIHQILKTTRVSSCP